MQIWSQSIGNREFCDSLVKYVIQREIKVILSEKSYGEWTQEKFRFL